jgi:dolichol kinase
MDNILRNEIKRKGFHLLSLIYIFAYWYLPKYLVVWCFVIAISLVILLECIRFKLPGFNIFFKNNFRGFYRYNEADKISGLVWTLLGALLAIIIFHNKYMVLASFFYLAFGDTMGALVGKSFGKHKIFTGKSLEGSLGCMLMCFILGLFFFNLQFAFIGAVIATLVEAIPWKLNDNFWMQIINAWALTLLSNIMLWMK